MTDALTAQCSVHPDAPSIGTCARCGRFMCIECRLQSSRLLCHQCAPLLGPVEGLPFRPFSAGGALSSGFALLRATGWRILLSNLPFALVCASTGLLQPQRGSAREPGDAFNRFVLTMSVSVLSAVLSVGGVLTALALMVGEVEGRPISVREAWRRGVRAWPRAIGPTLASMVTIILLTMLCLVPGLWRAVNLCLVSVCIYVRPAERPLQLSTSLVAQRWWPVCGVFVVGSLLTLVPSAVINVALGVAIHRAEWMPSLPNVGSSLLAELGGALNTAFALATFYGLMVNDGRVNAGAEAGPG